MLAIKQAAGSFYLFKCCSLCNSTEGHMEVMPIGERQQGDTDNIMEHLTGQEMLSPSIWIWTRRISPLLSMVFFVLVSPL